MEQLEEFTRLWMELKTHEVDAYNMPSSDKKIQLEQVVWRAQDCLIKADRKMEEGERIDASLQEVHGLIGQIIQMKAEK